MNRNLYLFPFFLLLLFLGCNKERDIVSYISSDVLSSNSDSQDSEETLLSQQETTFVAKKDSPDSEESAIAQQEDIVNLDNLPPSINQAPLRKINEDSRIEIESVSVSTGSGEVWNIWKRLDEDFIKKTNTTITTGIFGVNFGPINGFEDEELRIGWNNRNVVLYIEVLSNEVKTFDGIALGDSKKKVLDILGPPVIEEEKQFRYHNIDFEIIGLLFQFDDDIVTKIYLFGYV